VTARVERDDSLHDEVVHTAASPDARARVVGVATAT
jgi:hypothetical protein